VTPASACRSRDPAGVVRDLRERHQEQLGEWLPRCFGQHRGPKAPPSAPRSPTPVPTSPRCAPAPGTRGDRRVLGAQRQKAWATMRHRRRARRRRAAIPTGRQGAGGVRSCRPARSVASPGEEAQEARAAGLAHRVGVPGRRPDPRGPPARFEESWTSGSPRPAGEPIRAQRIDVDLRAVPAHRRRAGDRHLSGAYEYALDYAKERKQFGRPDHRQQGIAFSSRT